MPSKSNNEDRQLEDGEQGVLQSTMYSQPWWRGAGNTNSSEGAPKSSLVENLIGSVSNGDSQSQANGWLDDGTGFNKEPKTTVAVQSDGNNGQEHRHLKQVASSTPPTGAGNFEPNSQMELVGHSIVLTSYPYSDLHYGGILAYGPHAMVAPHLYGVHHSRMPLPLDMEEEPVYVNAKQYHGILRRRQSRAKAELEKKVIKARKPYLHESRHQHALKRARGCGGRFLNTKKLDGNVAYPTSGKSMDSASECLHRNMPVSCYRQEGERSINQEMLEASKYSDNISNGHGLSSIYHSPSCDSNQRDFLADQGNGAPHGPLPIK